MESAVSYARYGSSQLFTAGETRLIKNTGVYTDAQFLTMFSFPLLKGDPSKDVPGAVVPSVGRQVFVVGTSVPAVLVPKAPIRPGTVPV